MANLDLKNYLTDPIYYQSKRFNKDCPFQVRIIKVKGKAARVMTVGRPERVFNCRLSSLFNI